MSIGSESTDAEDCRREVRLVSINADMSLRQRGAITGREQMQQHACAAKNVLLDQLVGAGKQAGEKCS